MLSGTFTSAAVLAESFGATAVFSSPLAACAVLTNTFHTPLTKLSTRLTIHHVFICSRRPKNTGGRKII